MGFWKSLVRVSKREIRREVKRQIKISQPRYTCNSCKRYTKGDGGRCQYCGKTELRLTSYRTKRTCERCGWRQTVQSLCIYCRTLEKINKKD